MLVEYKPVSYLTSDSFHQLGLFAEAQIPKSSVVNGVIGLLADLTEDEIVEGYNDMPIIYSKLRNVQ